MKNLLMVLIMTISLTSVAQEKWNSLDDIPEKWIMLERDSAGYLVYDPCNGGTPMIAIDSGYIWVCWRLDAPRKLHINKFNRPQEDDGVYYIHASDEAGDIAFRLSVKEDDQAIVLWTFGDRKWVMTPYESSGSFRHIDNPCPTEMKPEKQFLPPEDWDQRTTR